MWVGWMAEDIDLDLSWTVRSRRYCTGGNVREDSVDRRLEAEVCGSTTEVAGEVL